MQIMFILMIVALNGYIISNISDIQLSKAMSDRLSREAYQKFEVADAISQSVKLAYDLGQLDGSGCLGGAREISNIASSTPVKLCWVNLSARNCFNASETHGFEICLAQSQPLSLNTIHPNWYDLMIPSAHAFNWPNLFNYWEPGSDGPNEQVPQPDPYNKVDFNDLEPLRTLQRGRYQPLAAVQPGGIVLNAGARVILPTSDGLAVNSVVSSNFINCNSAYTDCFTLTFCINGSQTCNGKSRLTQTFAVRHY